MGLSFLVSTRANASILSLNGGFHKLLHILNIEIIKFKLFKPKIEVIVSKYSALFILRSCKCVSDLEMCMEYFCFPTQTAQPSELRSWPKCFLGGCQIFLSIMPFKKNERENSNFHNFFLEAQNNPYMFLNLRHLYYSFI